LSFSTLKASAGYTFDPASGNSVTVNLTTATTRFVRLTVTANTGWPAGQLAELEVYGPATGDTQAPCAPCNHAYTQPGSGQIRLTWSASTDNVGVTGYDVLRNGSVVASTANRSYTATGLSPSTGYAFTVRAYDAAGNRSSVSSAVSVTTSGTSSGIDATSRIQAEAYNGMAGVAKETTQDTDGGENIAWVGNGDHVRFDNVDVGSTPRSTFRARVASGAAGGVSGLVNVRLDSLTGPSIGSFAIASTGGWQVWQTVPANIVATTGTHTVYLTFDSGQPADFVNVNWFTFS
jgi:hypothetical protein